MAPVGVTIIVDQNLEVRRILNATIVARKCTSRNIVGVTRTEKRAKNLSVASASDDSKILYSEATTVSEDRK